MFAVEIYAAVGNFVSIKGNSSRETARVFSLSRETVLKMCRFSLMQEFKAILVNATDTKRTIVTLRRVPPSLSGDTSVICSYGRS
jgi:hypothetical protein